MKAGLLEKGGGSELSVGAVGPEEHPDEKSVRTRADTRAAASALMEGRLGTAPDRSSLVLLAARLILEEALESRWLHSACGHRIILFQLIHRSRLLAPSTKNATRPQRCKFGKNSNMPHTLIFAKVRTRLAGNLYEVRRQYYLHIWGMDIGKGSRISSSAKLDKTNPHGIHIGEYTSIGFGAAILAHDFINGLHKDVHIGNNCLIGAHAIILPGVKIGDQCIIAAGCVVMRNVPSGCLVVGNPGRIVEKNVLTGPLGIRRGGRWSGRRSKT